MSTSSAAERVDGTDRTGLAVLRFSGPRDDARAAFEAIDVDRHMVTVNLRACAFEMEVESARPFRGVIDPGTTNVLVAGERARLRVPGAFEVVHLLVPTALVREFMNQEELSTRASLELDPPGFRRDPHLEAVGRALAVETAQPGPWSRLRVDSLGTEIVAHLLRNRARHRLVRDGGPRLAPWQVVRVREYLEAHLDEDTRLATLAALVRLSSFHFCRAFRNTTGVPPQQYLTELRMERAKRLLRHTRLSIAALALAVGYESQATFATAFKRATGFTPGAWRRLRP